MSESGDDDVMSEAVGLFGGTSSDGATMTASAGVGGSSSSLKDKFCSKLEEFLSSNLDNKRSSVMSDDRYRELIAETKEAKRKKLRGEALTAKQHRRFKRFDVLSTTTGVDGKVCGRVERLIDRNSITSGDNVKFFCPAGELYDIIHSTHVSMGHKREKSMEMELKRKYCNVTRVLIKMYLELCPRCHLKRETRAPRVKKLTDSTSCHSWNSNPPSSGLESDACGYSAKAELNYRCQVDVVDMQAETDGDYRFVLNYHDLLTKFTVLRPLKTKSPDEVAYHLIDVFCLFGAPCVLHSDTGREFCNRVINNLSNWSNIKVVHGKSASSPKPGSSSSSSSECTNQEVRDSIVTWMANEKTTKWSEGLKFVQSSINRSFNRNIRRSPYEAMFGTVQRNGLLDTYLPKNIVQELQTEEDLEEALASHGMTVQQLLPQEGSVSEGALKEKEADNNQEQPSVQCVVCQKEASSTAALLLCSACKNPMHATCCGGGGEDAGGVCFLCARKRDIDVERTGCKRNLELLLLDGTAAESSDRTTASNKKFVDADQADRGRLVPRNMMASTNMTEVGLYVQQPTASGDGYFDCFYARNEFPVADSNFMQMQDSGAQNVKDVPSSVVGSSVTDGFIRCNCRIHCEKKRCSCKKNNVKCNVKCHGSAACANK